MALHHRSWRKSKSSKGLEVAMHMNYRQKQQELREEEEGFCFTSIKSHNHAAANSSIISSFWLHDDQISRQGEVSRTSPSRMSCADELFLDGKILPLHNTLHLNNYHSNCNDGTNYYSWTTSNESDIRHHHRLLSISSSAPASPLIGPADSIMDMLPHRPDIIQPRPPSGRTGDGGSTSRRRWWRSLSLFKRVPTHTEIQTADAPRPHLHTCDHAPHPHTPRPEDIFLPSKVQSSNLAKGSRTTLQDYLLAPTDALSQPLLQQCASPSNHLERSPNTHDHQYGASPSSSPSVLPKTSLRRHHQGPPTRDLPTKRSLSAHHQCTTPTKSHNKSLGAPHQGSNTSTAEGFHINRPTVRSRSLNVSHLHVAGTINSTSQRKLATVCPNHATTSKAQQRPINVGTALHSPEVPPKGWIHAKGNATSHQMPIAQGLPCPSYNVSSSCPSSPLYHWHTSINKNTTSSPARGKSSIPSTSYNASHVEKLDTKGIKRKTYLPNHHVLLNCLSFNFVKLQYHFSNQQNPLVH